MQASQEPGPFEDGARAASDGARAVLGEGSLAALAKGLMRQGAPVCCAAMERELTILNKLGLHARPAAEFVRCARAFKSTITLRKEGDEYSATSILDVLTANLDCGSTVIVVADGSDAELAIERLTELLNEFKRQEEQG